MAANSLLKEIHANAFGDKNQLQRLDLADNQLSQIDANLINWKQLKWLDLSGNRWDCNCQLLAFLPNILKKLNDSGYGGALCNLPEALFNVNIKDIEVILNCIFIILKFRHVLWIRWLFHQTII